MPRPTYFPDKRRYSVALDLSHLELYVTSRRKLLEIGNHTRRTVGIIEASTPEGASNQ